MSVRTALVSLAFVAACGLSGCQPLEPWGSFWHEVKRTSKVNPDDRRDETDESQEQWKFVGEEGRRGQEVEKDPDQWWRKYIMSEKARSIEENLGYE